MFYEIPLVWKGFLYTLKCSPNTSLLYFFYTTSIEKSHLLNNQALARHVASPQCLKITLQLLEELLFSHYWYYRTKSIYGQYSFFYHNDRLYK